MLIYIILIISISLLVINIMLIANQAKTRTRTDLNQKQFLTEIQNINRDNREEMSTSISRFSESMGQFFNSFQTSNENSMSMLSAIQKERLDLLEKKLEAIRSTVEEKLEKTLNERLGKSFETVGKQLIEVQKGLGEMQVLAQDVGGLKRVLSNVKMRGGIGEVQLSMLLENIMAPDQYERNVKTKSGSRDFVEFAIKLPGKETGSSENYIWLPVDAKFPKEYYETLQNAYDTCDQALIDKEQKNLENAIKVMARDISEKYIDPPYTTDFAIMFLPFEGIYAEVVRKAALLEEIQNKYKVLITGPATLAAILNSLQMGFRTLAIEKRSGEVWNTLGAVKKEFSTFGDLLTKAQKNIQGGLDDIDKLVGTRTRAIQRKLKEVEALSSESPLLLPEDSDISEDNDIYDND